MGEGRLGVMPEPAPATHPPRESRRPLSSARPAAIALAVAGFAVVMWGGYGHRWSWTGINGSTATLWDWLHLLLLPIALGLLPVLLSQRMRLRRGHRWAGSAALVWFAAFVAAGYAIPWSWTGFSGNRLWDWLELLALPLAVTLLPIMDEIRLSWSSRRSLAASVGLAGFVAIVIGGYVGNWTWTGFRGNTLWDWLHLLLLPLLLPTVIVPALKPRIEATMIVVEETGPGLAGGTAAGSTVPVEVAAVKPAGATEAAEPSTAEPA